MAQNDFSLSIEDGIALLKIDVQGERMNVLKAAFAAQLGHCLDELSHHSIKGMVIYSGKANSFVAGADISMIDACENIEQARALSMLCHDMFRRLAQLPFAVVAAIHGPCLGGGLELALACDYRVASKSSHTQLALPEVKLGVLPGGGGTQRLPRLLGLSCALDLMLTGRSVRAEKAKKMGLVDACVDEAQLLSLAKDFALKPARAKSKPRKLISQLESSALSRALVFKLARKKLLEKTRGNYPAPAAIIDCVEVGFNKSEAQAFDYEAKRFAELVLTPESKALRRVFFSSTALKKFTPFEGVKANEISRVGVLGGGLMGAGIALVSLNKAKAWVRVKDVRDEGVLHSLRYVHNYLSAQAKRRRTKRAHLQAQRKHLSGGTDLRSMATSQIVLEAVFEDVALKQQMVKELEAVLPENAIFASNTSSIPIAKIAEHATRPAQIIGLHYFSPVEKMPLVEVIPHENTAKQVTVDTLNFARKQGKTVIIVKDSAGFYVNRILAPYINEAGHLLLEGQRISHIDASLLDYGFPMGPLALLDQVGIDVASKIAPIMVNAFGERFTTPEVFERFIDDQRLGRKVEKGFYLYKRPKLRLKGEKHQEDEAVYGLLNITKQADLASLTLAKRCVYLMLNEAARCLDEGVISSVQDGDIGAIFGIGFPPFLGGPFSAIDAIGAQNVIDELRAFERQYGTRYRPCSALVAHASQGIKYYTQ